MRSKTTHEAIIEAIHLFQGEPFSIASLREITGASESSVTRVLRRLVGFKLLDYKPNCYDGRNYRISAKQWPSDAREAIEAYELGKAAGL